MAGAGSLVAAAGPALSRGGVAVTPLFAEHGSRDMTVTFLGSRTWADGPAHRAMSSAGGIGDSASPAQHTVGYKWITRRGAVYRRRDSQLSVAWRPGWEGEFREDGAAYVWLRPSLFT